MWHGRAMYCPAEKRKEKDGANENEDAEWVD
jgi:hypothetical protein